MTTQKLVLKSGRMLAYTIREHPSSRRISMRFDKTAFGLRLTIPRGLGKKKALDFALLHQDWIEKQMSDSQEAASFTPNTSLPFRGERLQLVHDPSALRSYLSDQELIIAGSEARFAAQCAIFFRRACYEDLKPRIIAKARFIGKEVGRIRIADQRSRWGSCSSNKTLSFSWRLFLAPEDVRDYLVAHEVAHLAQMNHSPAFWALCEKLTKGGRKARHKAETWLKEHGSTLHAIRTQRIT